MEYSLVVPAYNEAENLKELLPQVQKVMDGLGCSWELIVIDDGSTDETFSVLEAFHRDWVNLEVIRFRTNFGQTAGLSAGFKQAKGDVIITLDADLQNDPHDIPRILARINEGYDVVSGWRKHRRDPFLNRLLPSIIANALISWVTGVYLHDYGCTLKAYRRDVLQNFELYGELHRFIPALTRWAGSRITEIPVNHAPRKRGTSNYGIGRTFKVILDLITVKFLTSFSTQPIHIFGAFGLLSFLLGILSLGIVILLRLWMNFDMTGNPLLYASILFIFTATQFVLMGLLAEISIRTYHETSKKQIYVIRQVLTSSSRTTTQHESPVINTETCDSKV